MKKVFKFSLCLSSGIRRIIFYVNLPHVTVAVNCRLHVCVSDYCAVVNITACHAGVCCSFQARGIQVLKNVSFSLVRRKFTVVGASVTEKHCEFFCSFINFFIHKSLIY